MLWVVFEGTDGSGKTTLMDEVADWLFEARYDLDIQVVTCREPGDLHIRPLAIREYDVMTRQLLMAADARRNFLTNVEPYLEDDDTIVLQDRGAWSAQVYSGLEDPLVESLGHGGRVPDVYVYVDCPTETILRRLDSRSESLDQFDLDRSAIAHRKAAYEALVSSSVTTVVRVNGAAEDLHSEAAHLADDLIGLLDRVGGQR